MEKEEKLFEDQIGGKIKVTSNTTFNLKVVGARKDSQALYNEDANKIVEKALQEKATKENLNF